MCRASDICNKSRDVPQLLTTSNTNNHSNNQYLLIEICIQFVSILQKKNYEQLLDSTASELILPTYKEFVIFFSHDDQSAKC